MKPFLKPWVIAVVFLAGLFAWSLRTIWSRSGPTTGDEIVLRVAHWQLEGGVEAGFDAISKAFEAAHPGVRVEVLRIPERVYASWLNTQLIGGTAPDLIELRNTFRAEQKARYFLPLGDTVEQPNPYNAGTPLADVPWRDTFIDGMRGGFDETLGDHYGAPGFTATVRLFYNIALLRELTGSDQPPQTVQELLDLCAHVSDSTHHSGRKLLPIAGSSYNAPYLFDALMRTQLQELAYAINPRPRLVPEADAFFAAHLRGAWTLDHPDMRRTLALQREFGRYLQPGFLQLRREDATFYFTQRQALMITTGSWDAGSLRQECDFEIGVTTIPMPEADNPDWGDGVIGPLTEEGINSFGPFGISLAGAHPELALKLLQFMTSQPANRDFSTISGWLPVISGIDPRPEVQPFMPRLEGYPPAPTLRIGPDSRQAYERNLHVLFAPNGSVDDYLRVLKPEFTRGVRTDLNRALRSRERNIRQIDSGLEALRQLRGQPQNASNTEAAHRHDVLAETHFEQELEHAWLAWELTRPTATTSP